MQGSIVYPRYTIVERIILGAAKMIDRLLAGLLKMLRTKAREFQLGDFIDQIFDRRI
jgi:hypothetical protein